MTVAFVQFRGLDDVLRDAGPSAAAAQLGDLVGRRRMRASATA